MFDKFRKLILLAAFINVRMLWAEFIQDEQEQSSSRSFIDLYEQGVNSYLSNEYDDCVYFLESANEKYRNYYETTANCRLECEYASRDIKNRGDFLHPVDIENLHFYELILKRTLCLTKCRLRNKNHLPFEEDFDGYFMDIFKRRQAYSYLHSCYTKTQQFNLAASAALTYMAKNLDDRIMQKNFEIAIERLGTDEEEIVDLEEKRFVKLFIAGVLAVNDKNWEKVISSMESSIMQFIFDENQCRAFCEGEFDHGFLPDFVSAMGNHFTNALYCKRNCTAEMKMVRGKYYENLFAGHYQYLQIAYYEVKKYEESYRTGLSYLLFHENSPEMLDNLKRIEKEVKGILEENYFKVRREAKEYFDRNEYEKLLISFIKTEFDNISNTENAEYTSVGEDFQQNDIRKETTEKEMQYESSTNAFQRNEL